MKPSTFVQVAAMYMRDRAPFLVTSAPGMGKTDMMLEAAELAGIEQVYILIMSGMDPTTIQGLGALVKTERGIQAEFLLYGDIRKLCEATVPTLCFLDDLGQTPLSIQPSAMQLLRLREANGHKISDLVTFSAATNGREHKAGVSSVIEPLKSRFETIIELEPDLDDLCAWLLRKGFDPLLPAFLRYRPEYIFNWKPTTDMTNGACSRTMEHVGKALNRTYPNIGARDECLKGAAGQPFSIEFPAFLDLHKKLPSLEKIILDPQAADLPDRNKLGTDYTACMFALCGALNKKATTNTIDSIYAYAMRLPEEYAILLGRDLETAHKDLVANSKGYQDWYLKFKDDLFYNNTIN